LKRHSYIVFIFCFVTSFVSAQKDATTDSLLNLLSQKITDTTKVNVLNDLAQKVVDFPDSSYRYASVALELAQKINFKRGLARSYSRMGEVYNAKGNYNLALKNLHESYRIYDELGNKKRMSIVMNSIGNTHLGNRDNNKALESFRKCYQIGLEINDNTSLALSSFGVGNIFGELGIIDSATKYLNYALSAFSKEKNKYGEAMTFALIGQLENREKKYAESLHSLNKSMKLFKEINQMYGVGVVSQSLGKTYYDSGDNKNALKNYLEAFDVHLKRNAFDNIKETCQEISLVYKKLGDYKSSLAYHELYVFYKDSVFNEKSRKQLLEIETQYQTQNKEKEIQLKNLELEKSNDAIKSRTIILFVFIFVSLIFLIMAFFVYKQYKQKKIANIRIMKQKDVIEAKNKSITDSIRYAQYIQESILPDDDMTYSLLRESFVLYMPKDIVSGDFYWIVASESYVYAAVVDCTGHGVPGAFMSMVGYNSLKNAIKQLKTPDTSQVLSFLQQEVRELFKHNYNSTNVRDGMDLSLIRIDRKNMKLQFSGANNPLCYVRDNTFIECKGDKVAISAHTENRNTVFTQHEIDIKKGDALYLFSDGYVDQFGGPKGKKFKYKQFQQMILSAAHLPMNEQKNLFQKIIKKWQGDLEQIDDILVLGLKI